MRDSPGCFLAFVPCSPALSIVIGESGANFESRRGLMLPNTFPQAHFFNTILHSPVVFLLSGFTSFLKPFNRLCYKPSLQARRSLSQPPLSKSTNRYFFSFFFDINKTFIRSFRFPFLYIHIVSKRSIQRN